MKMRRTFVSALITIAITIALAAGVTACGGDGGEGGGGASEIKIGTLYPVTGDLAKLGQECVNGVKLAVDEINAAGGIKSMNGAKLDLVEADSQGKPDVGIAEVERLVQQDNVSAIIGTYQSSVAMPATQAAQRLQIPIVISMAVADDITDKGYKYIFRICPKADWYAKDQIDFCKALPDAGRPDDPEDRPPARGHRLRSVHRAGSEEVRRRSGHGSRRRRRLRRFRRRPHDAGRARSRPPTPDIVLTATYLNDAILIAQAREKLGMTQLFFDAAGGTVDPEFINRLGDGRRDAAHRDRVRPRGRSRSPRSSTPCTTTKYGVDMTGNGAYGYQAVYVIAKALEDGARRPGQAPRRPLSRQAGRGHSDIVVMPYEEITFTEDGQIASAPLFVVQIQRRRAHGRLPDAGSAAKVILP